MVRDGGVGRRAWGVVLVFVLCVLVGGAGWWASRATLPDSSVGESSSPAGEVVWGEVVQGSVGRSLPLSTTVRQPVGVVAVNGLSGVVTSTSPGRVESGAVVYVVGRTPVRVVQAGEPFWRELSRGARGEDVTALQELLVAGGYLGVEADGDFGQGTEDAVEAWQEEQGLPESGVVGLGELVAVPDLPATVTVGEVISVGAQVSGGEDAVLAPTGERDFEVVVSAEQARLIPAEATVEMSFEGRQWTGVIAGSSVDESGSTVFELTAPGGGPVCGEDCGVLPGDEQVTVRSEVVVVPRVEGLSVPAAAVRTRADGSAYVVTEDGGVDVVVAGSGQGVAIVEGEGLVEGLRVLVAGDPVQAPGDGGDETGGG
ncbi:peptidoglycan-binding domain-containing protein [uncultured Serinicoccus sp.]|uniref:peptidoglycan-binding domain-containing protein n=1 Tax=uncultured Serinicoccus sp. TaxID=735514 RepID=UPI00262E02A9|nr:peptidoglycan-binding domain-containing protein [uncultured Serinicoccus sp.]